MLLVSMTVKKLEGFYIIKNISNYKWNVLVPENTQSLDHSI